MYRLIGDNHTLGGLPFSAQVFLRSLEGVRRNLARDAGLSGVELRALARVAEDTGITTSALTEHLEMSEAATGSVVEALVKKGLLNKPASNSRLDDAEFRLTESGHAAMERVYLEFQDAITKAADSLDDERRFAFDSALLKMARKLDAAASTPRELDT